MKQKHARNEKPFHEKLFHEKPFNEKSINEKPVHRIQQEIMHAQVSLIILLTALITVMGISLTLYYERKRLDENLQNVAESIAHTQMIQERIGKNVHEHDESIKNYLDSLSHSLSNIDVISVVGMNKIRYYHSNEALIGTTYDGTIPVFIQGKKEFYASSDRGPSGSQRRAYAAIYQSDGTYVGFVMAVMLEEHIQKTTFQMLSIYFLAALVVICISVITSIRLSERIKKQLLGYEPDTFSAMFKIRENVLESLEEGILAVNKENRVVFINQAARQMLGAELLKDGEELWAACKDPKIMDWFACGTKQCNIQHKTSRNIEILADFIPIQEHGQVVGAAGIFRNRTEYTKLMEDLSGVRYMVDSMRANNHDFTNKLHVILGLIQMEDYDAAVQYIMNVTLVQRETIHFIMHAIEEPSVAALLIGKHARASELNIRFALKQTSSLKRSDISIPAEVLVTIIGNLIDNAMDAMNHATEQPKELIIGIFSRPGNLVITSDDSGCGMRPEVVEHMFENGYSTKGEGRGTGMYQVKHLVESYQGTINVESEWGDGTSFTITMKG